VTALRKRLADEDPAAAASVAATYDKALAEQVRSAQKRFGLEPNGIANKATIAALNVPTADRVRQIMANLERWRWLPPELPTHRIQVNIAAAVLTVFEADKPVISMRAVTGRPGDETPMLTSQIHSIVFNPPWNVPSSIAAKEYWPKEKANPGYLAKKGFRIIDNPDGTKRIQQPSGPRSALGLMKFDFNNPYGVYLHDTPTRGTFGTYSRLESHGCVRLEKPLNLAKLVLRDDPVWTSEAVDAALAAGKTVRAKLPEQVSVYLLYWTAFAGANGQMSFRADPYGWDGLLARKIEARNANPAQVVTAAK
jgi:murein L,D-transpeptidase YcbB/YkuD